MSNSTAPRQNSDERLIFGVAVAVAIIFGLGYVGLMLALNHREKSPGVPGPSDAAAPISPDRARQLVDFSLTDRP